MAEDITKDTTNLIINRLTRQKYHEMKIAGTLKDDELYIITDDTLDAVGNRITNVASPTLSSDAVNKDYVDKNTVSAFAFNGQTYYKSSVDLGQIYSLMFQVAHVLGATVIDDVES